ncbi:MAG: hypothetical protein AAF492_28180, partial [Verrucomicrobiota bacterium]
MHYRLETIDALTPRELERMFELMTRHYWNVDRDVFRGDLCEKSWVILLEDDITETVQGFSTQQVYRTEHEGRMVNIVFSGDTIIAREHWGSQQLPLAFGRMMLSILDRDPDTPLYWFLISKGHRTYRYLPVFYRRFYPGCQWPTPSREQGLMDRLARTKFGPAYDEARGVVRAMDVAQKLEPELAHIDPGKAEKDPHIRFFLERNPDYAEGEELVCLAPFYRENLKPFILRQLEQEA